MELIPRLPHWRGAAASAVGIGRRLWVVNALLGTIAAALTVAVLSDDRHATGDVLIPWWGIAIAYLLASVFVVHITFRNSAHTLTVSEVALVIGLVATPPSGLIAGGLVGTTVALMLWRRQQTLKLVFNLVLFLVEADTAVLLQHRLLGTTTSSSALGWLATLTAVVSGAALTQLLCAAVVAASARRVAKAFAVLPIALGTSVVNAVLGLAGLHVIGHDAQAAALLIIPVAAMAVAYRGYLGERHKHARVRLLYDTSGALHRSRGGDAPILTLLSQAREMFNAEVAELIVQPADRDGEALRYSLGPTDDARLVSLPIDAATTHALPTSNRAPVILDRNLHPELLAGGEIRDGLLAPLRTETGPVGTLIVANRRDAVSTFDRSDLELMEAFAGPASVSIDHQRLVVELEHRATHDSLTQLGNRALLARRIEAALAGNDRGRFAVLLLDIDDFKAVNDTLGHPAGDELLIAVADRLRRCVGPDDTATRFGGDEFAILLGSVTDAASATHVAGRILEAISQPITLSSSDVRVHGSIGVVMDSSSVVGVDDLLSRADLTMYRAKAEGKNRCVVFEPLMHAEVMARHQMRTDLERALSDQKLCVHYQPIVSLRTGQVIGAEALVRWTHPQRGAISPDEFIPLAEETGLIVPLGRFVLDTACAQLAQWSTALPQFQLSVNLSGRQLQDVEVVADIAEVMASHAIDPRRITLEVTERVIVADSDAVSALRKLRGLGMRIAVDDFGTGYSSLSCLSDLPIDSLKVAKPFVDHLARSDDDRALATTIITLAASLRLDTVAEGIERPDQAATLHAAGCHLGQGFLYSRALPPAEFLERAATLNTTAARAALSIAG